MPASTASTCSRCPTRVSNRIEGWRAHQDLEADELFVFVEDYGALVPENY